VEQLAAAVEKTALAPARRRGLLDDEYIEPARPGTLHAHGVHPREPVYGAAHRGEVHRKKPRTVHLRLDDAFDVHRSDALKAPGNRDGLDRLVEHPGDCECEAGDERWHTK